MNRVRAGMLIVALLVSGLLPTMAQTSGSDASAADSSVFAPYVTRLRVAVKDPVVMLTWEDPTDVQGTLKIYRSTSEITDSSFASAEPVGEANEGAGSFIDVPKSPGSYYYAVLVDNPSTGIYKVFVPFRNVTLQPVAIATTATPADLAASISGIRTSVSGQSVTISYTASRTARTLDVYRATSPIQSSEGLAGAILVQSVSSATTRVTDYPVPGVKYFYAVIDTALVQAGKASFAPGQNSTSTGIEVPLGTVTSGIPRSNTAPPRATPLPYLLLSQDLQTGAGLAPSLADTAAPTELKPATETAVRELIDGLKVQPPPEPDPVVLGADRAAADKGESYTLKTIVDTAFDRKDWAESEKLLENLLTLPLSDDVRSRAQFYLGQSFYFQGLYRQSFVAFLLARDQYYIEVTPWINDILDKDL